jgi:branched-chain amino acid transport system permease protein
MSGLIVLMTLLGGAGTIFGPLVGATIVVALESLLATSPFPVPVITGAVYILCVLMFRRGISRRAHAEMTERERTGGGRVKRDKYWELFDDKART